MINKEKRMKVTKISDNIGYIDQGQSFEGIVLNFREESGLILHQDNGKILQTSMITKIDLDNNEFKTINSTYKFYFL